MTRCPPSTRSIRRRRSDEVVASTPAMGRGPRSVGRRVGRSRSGRPCRIARRRSPRSSTCPPTCGAEVVGDDRGPASTLDALGAAPRNVTGEAGSDVAPAADVRRGSPVARRPRHDVAAVAAGVPLIRCRSPPTSPRTRTGASAAGVGVTLRSRPAGSAVGSPRRRARAATRRGLASARAPSSSSIRIRRHAVAAGSRPRSRATRGHRARSRPAHEAEHRVPNGARSC